MKDRYLPEAVFDEEVKKVSDFIYNRHGVRAIKSEYDGHKKYVWWCRQYSLEAFEGTGLFVKKIHYSSLSSGLRKAGHTRLYDLERICNNFEGLGEFVYQYSDFDHMGLSSEPPSYVPSLNGEPDEYTQSAMISFLEKGNKK